MVDKAAYVEELEQALDRRKDFVEGTELLRAKEMFRNFQGAFQNLYNVLLRKSLIQEDPYKNDQKISEVVVPDNTPLPESEKSDRYSVRLSEFDSQLEFLINYYQFSVDYLSLGRIKLLAGLLNFVKWHQISENSSHYNTRCLGELLQKVRGGKDSFSIGLLNDACNQTTKSAQEITEILRELAIYHRERYKLDLRQRIIAGMNLDPQAVAADPAAAAAEIKRKFGEVIRDRPFYKELVDQILAEDYTPAGPEARAEILATLAVQEEKPQQKQETDHKALLLEAVRILSTASNHVENSLSKLDENSKIIEEQRRNVDGVLRRFIQKLFGKQESRVYEVEFLDSATTLTRTEKVDFDTFLTNGMRAARKLAAYQSRAGAAYNELENADEAALFSGVETTFKDIQHVAHYLQPLAAFFQTELDRENRAKLRGIKLELNAIRNAVVKANQRRHEYVSRREEKTLLKKLGVKDKA